MERQGLIAPESYWNLNEDEKYEITNGCGPANATDIIPSRICCVNLRPACDIHDYTYAKPESMNDRLDADDLFWVNMHHLILRLKFPPTRFLATIGIGFYYLAVRLFGRSYFAGN